MRIWQLFSKSVLGFIHNNNYLHAAALTFYSLLSLVPLLAFSFAIAQMLGLEAVLRDYLLERFADWKEFIEQIITFSYSYLNQAKQSVFALSFALLYFWIVLTLFASLENAFNQIWNVPKGRTILGRLGHYFILTIVCPIFALSSSVLSLFLNEDIQKFFEKSPFLGPIISNLSGIYPYLVAWILFLLLYKFVPNIRVSWRSALIASLLAGSAYQITQWIFIHFQIGVAQYGAIFGSFAAIPLFLLWLQVSWIILLFGAEIASRLNFKN